MTKAFYYILGLILLALCALVSAGEPWTQFRGPGGRGISDAQGLPIHWSEEKNIRWKTEIHGRAWSSPVILDGQMWLTTATEDGRELFAMCVEQESGKIIHDLKLFDVEQPQFAHKFNTYGSPTPVIESGRVYITFGSPGTACLDTRTGRVLWERRDFVCNHFRGAGSSPILDGPRLLMHFDGSDYQYVVALDKQTGKTLWKTDRSIDFKDLTPEGKPTEDGDLRKAFSTPVVTQFAGETLMLSMGSKSLYAYESATGKEIWRMETRRAHSGTVVPTATADLIYFCTGFPRGELLAIRPGGRGVLTESDTVWKVSRNVPCKPSLLVGNELIYMIDDGGIASCLEAKTGKEIWRERVAGNYSASPLYAEGRLYFFSEEGKATVVAADRQFKVLAENELGDGFMASPAVAGKALFLRSRTHLYRVEAE